MGALGRRVERPEDIQEALDWAVEASEERGVPALVEILCERETNAAMGLSIDKINEYEPILDGSEELAGTDRRGCARERLGSRMKEDLREITGGGPLRRRPGARRCKLSEGRGIPH